MGKKPKIGTPQLSSGKRIRAPQAEVEDSPQLQPPVFSLRHLRPGYSLPDCTVEQKAAFADTLHKLSQMTWAQINVAPRHGNGTEIIAQGSIKAGIPSHITTDVNLLAFRFFGMAPMVGYRDRAVFYVVWIDPRFTLYDH